MIVSIFTPVHKIDRFFELCVDSITGQSYKDWEWIILDTSPEQEVEKFVKNYLDYKKGWQINEDLKKIKFYQLPDAGTNIGTIKRIAAGYCIGDLLLEHDRDDLLHERYVEFLVQAAKKHPYCNFFYSDWVILKHYENGMIAYLSDVGEPIDKTSIIFDGQVIANVPVMARRDFNFEIVLACLENPKGKLPIMINRAWKRDFYNLIGGFDKTMEISEDYELQVRSLVYGAQFCRVSFPGYIYNAHNGNSANGKTFSEIKETWDKIARKYEEKLRRLRENKITRFIPQI